MNHFSFRLVLASTNIHKIREMKEMLKKLPQIDLLTLRDFPDYIPPKEDGNSFEENARIKAEHAAKALQAWVIADDSGIVVPALKGAPGIYSKRFSGENATDKDNRQKLLKEMAYLLDEDRYAFYECCMALASKERIQKITSATCEGSILTEEKGGSGFGYDPLFLKHGYNRSFGELSEALKNEVSHRRKAMERMLPTLESLLSLAATSSFRK